MHFVIDGYNLLHVMGLMAPKMGPTGLQKSRSALLGTIAGALKEQSGNATVVFDSGGAPPDAVPTMEHRGVQVRFAEKGQQADDLIEKLINSSSTPSQLTVVSNDNRLIKAASRRGCPVQNCDAFLGYLRRSYQQKPRSTEPAEKQEGLGAGQTARWLQEFADLADDPAWAEISPYGGMREK